jgi:hypothetical protein
MGVSILPIAPNGPEGYGSKWYCKTCGVPTPTDAPMMGKVKRGNNKREKKWWVWYTHLGMRYSNVSILYSIEYGILKQNKYLFIWIMLSVDICTKSK